MFPLRVKFLYLPIVVVKEIMIASYFSACVGDEIAPCFSECRGVYSFYLLFAISMRVLRHWYIVLMESFFLVYTKDC